MERYQNCSMLQGSVYWLRAERKFGSYNRGGMSAGGRQSAVFRGDDLDGAIGSAVVPPA